MTLKPILLASCAALTLGVAQTASAGTILVFGQNGTPNTVTITESGTTSTTITGTDIAVTITALENGSTQQAFLDFTATSTGSAALSNGNDQEHFNGSFSICSTAASCTATTIGGAAIDYLSGSFTDLGSGSPGGNQFTLGASTPGDSVTFFTQNSPITSLGLDRSFSFAFTNWTPGVAINGTSIAPATASVAGNFSALNNVTTVPEPASLLLFGTGLASLVARRRSRRAGL